MTDSTTINNLADLSWTEQLPSVSGDYYVSRYNMRPSCCVIEMEDGVPISLNDGWAHTYYKAGQGYQFFGPLLVPSPPVLPHHAALLNNNPIQGIDSDV
jgi:hypothetical protein